MTGAGDATDSSLNTDITLRNGVRIRLRPVRPDDKRRIVCGMQRLSPESRYYRFFTPASELSSELLRYLTEVDQKDHVAWIAVNLDEPEEPGVAIARWVRLPGEPGVAEFAITVVDAWQAFGIGKQLFAILTARGRELGIQTMRAIVLPENVKVLQWMRRAGATSKFVDSHVQLDLPI